MLNDLNKKTNKGSIKKFNNKRTNQSTLLNHTLHKC